MKTVRCSLVSLSVVVFLIFGCTPRSISNSGYQKDQYRGYPNNHNQTDFSYRGELTEFQILGINTQKVPSEDDINKALKDYKGFTIKKNGKILLVQSGAVIPDESMVQELENDFSIGPFSGVPQKDIENENYSKLIRLMAARGGYETIVCYWGILETGKMNQATKTVSWVPIVGWALPDQKDLMRIRLKVALLDVRSGSWDVFMPKPFSDSKYSSIVKRKDVDQGLVQNLKEKAYSAAASEIITRYTK